MRAVVPALLAVAACSFSISSGPSGSIDAPDVVIECETATPSWWNGAWTHRYRVDTGGAPAGYTLRVPAAEVIARAEATTRDLRAVVHDGTSVREIDRVVESTMVVVKVPVAGTLWFYVGNSAASAPAADPANVYLFAESFDTLAVDSDGSPSFSPMLSADWRVADDAGNRVYRVLYGSRYSATIPHLVTDGELQARVRLGPELVQQHMGLFARGSNLVEATFDGYVAQLQGDVNRSRIAEYVDGISPPTELAVFDRAIVRGTWYQLRLRFAGSLAELYVDDVLEASVPTISANGALLGLFSHHGYADYDDVRLRRVIIPEPVALLGAAETCAR